MDYATVALLVVLVILVGFVLDSVRNLGEDLDNRLAQIEDRLASLETKPDAPEKGKTRTQWDTVNR